MRAVPFIMALLLCAAGCAENVIRCPEIEPEVSIAPEWNAIFERSDGWIGGDGAATIDLGYETLWLWGDSGIGRVESGKYAPGSTLVNNAVAVHSLPRGRGRHSTPPAADSIRFAWGAPGADGKQAALFVPARPGEWYWPTGGGISLEHGERLVLFMSRLYRPREKDDTVWNFDGRGSDMLVIDSPGSDPRTWKTRVIPTPGAVGDDLKRPERRITWGTSVLAGPIDGQDGLYMYGVDTTDPMNKKAVLATVYRREVDDVSKWSFCTGGSVESVSSRVEDAAAIAEHIMDEFSVSEILPTDDRFGFPFYVMIHSEEMLGRRILARTSGSRAGPWTEPKVIYECPEPLTDKRLMVYSAKAHPELSGTDELLVSYCVNSTDFWHMLSDASIYRPRFVRVPLSSLPWPPAR